MTDHHPADDALSPDTLRQAEHDLFTRVREELARDRETETEPTEAIIRSLTFGIGEDIFRTLLPRLEAVNHELILVTCFWARSPTLDLLGDALRALSARAIRQGQQIRVRIGFSSLSFFQKLFHTTSPHGQTYPPATWAPTLGLPPPEQLTGLDLRVKSIFYLPFSVMHPKFLLCDRAVAFFPSCNVSWETWFEGCVEVTGPICHQLLDFYTSFWARDEPPFHLRRAADIEEGEDAAAASSSLTATHPTSPATTHHPLPPPQHPTATFLLPSPHHRNPFLNPHPRTPLNASTLTLLHAATRTIVLQTPNLTSPPVIAALLTALRHRRVAVHLTTSRALMRAEQCLTAGTTGARAVRRFVAEYRRLAATATTPLGRLVVEYFHPASGAEKEPTQTHVKLAVVDDVALLLGSGNQDRASWWTSQELGVLFFDAGVARMAWGMARRVLEEGRIERVFDSEWDDDVWAEREREKGWWTRRWERLW